MNISPCEVLSKAVDIMKDVERMSSRNGKFKILDCFSKKTLNTIIDKRQYVLTAVTMFVDTIDTIDEEHKQFIKEYIKNDLPYTIDSIINFYNTVKH